MSDPMSAFTHALRTHLINDAAFAGIGGRVREGWPRREHVIPDLHAAVAPEANSRPIRHISTGEMLWSHPMRVLFGVRLKEDEEGRVIALLMQLAHDLSDDLLAPAGVLEATSLPTGWHYQRVVLGGFQINPSPYGDDPAAHAVALPIEVQTCKER